MQFARHLAEMDCAVTVVTGTVRPSTPAMEIVPVPCGKIWGPLRPMVFARRAARYVRSRCFDVVHGISACPAVDIYQPRGGALPEMLRRNLAIRGKGLERGKKYLLQKSRPKYWALAHLERQLVRRRPQPWVIAISDYVHDQFRRHYGLDDQRMPVIFNGVDPDPAGETQRQEDRWQLRRQYRLADDELLLLSVAHNFKLKGVARLIEAVARLKAEQPKLKLRTLVVGRDDPGPYADWADQLGVADRIIFAGDVQRIGAFYHAADVLVHPTYYDPCSRVVLEALAAGLPVVTTRYNGAAERVTDGRQGFVIDEPGDVDALADRIGRLADDSLRRQCAAGAAEVVESLTMARHAEQVVELYRQVFAEGAWKQGGYR